MSTPPQVTDKMQVIGHLDQYNLIIQYRKMGIKNTLYLILVRFVLNINRQLFTAYNNGKNITNYRIYE